VLEWAAQSPQHSRVCRIPECLCHLCNLHPRAQGRQLKGPQARLRLLKTHLVEPSAAEQLRQARVQADKKKIEATKIHQGPIRSALQVVVAKTQLLGHDMSALKAAQAQLRGLHRAPAVGPPQHLHRFGTRIVQQGAEGRPKVRLLSELLSLLAPRPLSPLIQFDTHQRCVIHLCCGTPPTSVDYRPRRKINGD